MYHGIKYKGLRYKLFSIRWKRKNRNWKDCPKKRKAIEIVQRWSDEHPQKTYLSEFLKHYPNTLPDDDGTPKGVCLYALGLINKDDCDNNCVKCWNQLIEDGEE